MEALKSLPASPRLSDPALTEPESLKDWLELLCLSEYFDVFQHNGFTSMERIHMLWEVELTSVSFHDNFQFLTRFKKLLMASSVVKRTLLSSKMTNKSFLFFRFWKLTLLVIENEFSPH